MKNTLFKVLSSQSIYFLSFLFIILLSFFLPNSFYAYYFSPTRITFIYVPLTLILLHFAMSDFSIITFFLRVGIGAYHRLCIGLAFVISFFLAVIIFITHKFIAINLFLTFEGYYMHVLFLAYILTVQLIYLSVRMLAAQPMFALVIVVLAVVADYILPIITPSEFNFVNEVPILRSAIRSTLALGLPLIGLIIVQIPLQSFLKERDYID